MIFELAKGFSLLLALSFVQQWLVEHGPDRPLYRDILSGVLFGLICVVGMATPLVLTEGIIFDPRSVILSMAGLFGGPVVAAVAGTIAAVFRGWIVGGEGGFLGMVVVAVSALWGLGFRAAIARGWIKLNVLTLLGLGLAVHLTAVGIFMFLPPEIARAILERVAAPFLLVFVPATLVMGLLLRDIQQRAETKRELTNSEQRLQYVFDHVATAICIEDLSQLDAALDRLRRRGIRDIRRHLDDHPDVAAQLAALVATRDANPAALDLFEAPSKPALIDALTSTFGPETPQLIVDLVGAMWDGESAFRAEASYRTLTGRPITTILSMPLPTGPEDGRRVPVSMVDITERRGTEKAIMAAKAEAERANRAKSEFLAAMSHDLRTPLNAIVGFAEMMRIGTYGPVGDPHYEQYVADIHSSGLLLVSLINDILDLSKVEAGHYTLNEDVLNVAEIIDATITQVRGMAADRGQSLVAELPDPAPRLRADHRVIHQVLNNLLTNAIKFSPNGSIIRMTAGRGTEGGIDLAVIDRGIGMSETDIEKSLRPFEQADSEHARRHQGTGLGLYLCLTFMRLHGGSLTIQSEPGVGTEVIAHFPADRRAG